VSRRYDHDRQGGSITLGGGRSFAGSVALVTDPMELNLAHWNDLARVHGQDRVYDVKGWLAGASSLYERERSEMAAAVGDVSGLDLLHIQCHFGLDTLSWARLGARVTGLDFSPVALERARGLADQAGLEATFIEADAQRLPADLAGRFDVVFASYGALCWIADLGAWFRSAATALRTGGKLVVVEIHPLVVMLESVDPLSFDYPYLGGEPQPWEGPGSYADPNAPVTATATVSYPYGVGEVVTAAAAAGLRIDALTEWLDEEFDPMGDMLAPTEAGRYELPVSGQRLPVTLGLRASRPT
jgi:SAM-dependent methyltransferase